MIRYSHDAFPKLPPHNLTVKTNRHRKGIPVADRHICPILVQAAGLCSLFSPREWRAIAQQAALERVDPIEWVRGCLLGLARYHVTEKREA